MYYLKEFDHSSIPIQKKIWGFAWIKIFNILSLITFIIKINNSHTAVIEINENANIHFK